MSPTDWFTGDAFARAVDAWSGDTVAKTARNAAPTLLAMLVSTTIFDAKCQNAPGFGGLIVCGEAKTISIFGIEIRPYGGKGTTYGNVFVTGDKMNRLLDGSDYSNALLSHEAQHMDQWATYGAGTFPVLYLAESVKSFALTGNWNQCMNGFEFNAGFLEGGYSALCY